MDNQPDDEEPELGDWRLAAPKPKLWETSDWWIYVIVGGIAMTIGTYFRTRY